MAVPTEPLVGREVEVDRLDLALDALAEGRRTYVAIEGEPGIGKTRLLGELRARAEERGDLVLDGRAAEFERDVPFAVLVDCLDAYAASHEEAVALEPELRAELGAMLPSLATDAAPARLGDERFRAHRAVRRLFERLSSARPLVIALDDLHWADAASIELIGSLLRRGPDAPVLLALAFRPRQAPDRLSAALAVPWLTRLTPAELTEAESVELLAGVDPPARAAIYREAGGNPFYLEQLARRLGAAPPSGARRPEIGVPPAVAASLAEELDGLSTAASRLLESAAVAGEPFEPDLAADIAELSPADGLTALDELLALDLVRPTVLPRRFMFRHPLVRRAVYESAPGGWRIGAHARAAAGLAARGAAPIERAHHVEHSASRGDEQAIAVLLEAAAGAAGRAPAAAVHQLEAALRLLPADDAERQAGVRVSLASALRSAGELARCHATLLEAIELLPPDARVELTASCAAVEHWLGRHDDAHRRLLRAWDELADRGSAEAAALQIELTIDGLYALDLAQAQAMGAGALATARELGDPALIASAAAALGLAETAAGRKAGARGHADEVTALVAGLSNAELAPHLETLLHLGWIEIFQHRLDHALTHLDRGLDVSRTTGDGRLLVPIMLARATPLEQRRLPEAIESCEAAVEAARLTDNPQYLYWALWELGWRHYLAGDLDAAIEAAEESERVCCSLHPTPQRRAGSYMRPGSGEPGWTLGAALIKRGDVERGIETMLAGVGGPELEHVTPVERSWAWELLTLAELARGQPGAALEYARRAEDDAASHGLAVPTAIARRARAAVALASGDAPEAVRLAEEAIAAAAPSRARLELAVSRLVLGRALAAAGPRKRAIDELRAAERELDACGALRERNDARRELRRLGARAEPRGPAAGDTGVAALTAREREIAELVTDRRTNREIAAELYLSEKTIEAHMRNIFIKLGASSRVAVARAIERDRR